MDSPFAARATATKSPTAARHGAAATGYAILEAPSREALIADVKDFLGLAGDGVSEIIEISEAGPPPQ